MRARLKEKVEEADLALALKIQDGKSPQWAAANVEFADALYALATEEDDRTAFTCYQQAITAYEEALNIYTDADHPDEWSSTTVSLAKTLRTYAVREGGDMGRLRLERARQLVEDVIQIVHDTKNIADHAVLYVELAHICRACADTDRSDKRRAHLEETIAAFAQAAKIFKSKEQFDHWVVTLVGQATAWREISELAGAELPAALYHAADLFKSALNYYTRESHPFDWIYVHFEYGRTFLRIALASQDQHRHDAASAAVDALRIATDSTSRQDAPDLWLRLRMKLALALSCLAQCPQTKNSFRLLEEATKIYKSAAGYYEEKEKPVDFALMQGNLGKSLIALAATIQGEESQTCRLKAIDALRKSVTPALKNERRQEWITNFIELGTAFHLTANHDQTEKRFSLYEEAVEIYREALSLIARDNEPNLRARLQSWVGLALAYLGENDESDAGLRRLKESELAFRLALTHHEEKGDSPEYARLKSNIGNLFYTIARRSNDQEAAVYLRDARQTMLQAIKNLDARFFPAEWSTAQWNYGLVLKHAILRGLSDHVEKDYDEAAAAFKQALSCQSSGNDPLSCFSIKRALASLLLMRAKNPVNKTNALYIEEALILFTEIYDWAEQNGHADIAYQTKTDISEVKNCTETQNMNGFLKKLHRFFK